MALSRTVSIFGILYFNLNGIDVIKKMKNENKLTTPLNVTFLYEDDVLSLNNCKFGDFFYHIYPIERPV
jgi:hypothetical protein